MHGAAAFIANFKPPFLIYFIYIGLLSKHIYITPVSSRCIVLYISPFVDYALNVSWLSKSGSSLARASLIVYINFPCVGRLDLWLTALFLFLSDACLLLPLSAATAVCCYRCRLMKRAACCHRYFTVLAVPGAHFYR